MSNSDFDEHNPSPPEESQERLSEMDIDQWLETLRRSDRSFYNIMALEVWSIAKTMDGLLPGFWSRFMANRRLSLQQFMQQKESRQSQNGTSPDSSETTSDSSEQDQEA